MGWAGRVTGAETHPVAAVIQVVTVGVSGLSGHVLGPPGGGVHWAECVAHSSPQASEAAVWPVGPDHPRAGSPQGLPWPAADSGLSLPRWLAGELRAGVPRHLQVGSCLDQESLGSMLLHQPSAVTTPPPPTQA